LRILDAYHRNTTVSRILNQLLPTPAVNASKTKIDRIGGQRSIAFKSPPLGRLACEVPEIRGVPPNLNFGHAIHDNFDCAFPSISTGTTHRGCAPRNGLALYGSCNGPENRNFD
jgi:hypothetical protein